ncbi:DUF2730 domain-containing protein [Pasteurella multocida]|uniref:DUF2730 domain-containing protein n=1 Tax=Pasteurella multocida TaxID=747 RepID=UPI00099DD2E0|nr:DUF2730 domain-containing protein [Pasteurella multocida]MCL7766561.1 DUF2730 domain-containing protein [Pasteurella multocida]MCL7768454.1 DUF2730 domain-containing protein [Pasteurella multocida]MCL7774059.1 DUF2730 domain-containing protein [Pasteurella multocida]MCL7823822.1 DUF2730 domain-containing protein [Pasteurella multocida]MCL7828395.1 DUF2730 domain-containing protein [Pasteurella multocida]
MNEILEFLRANFVIISTVIGLVGGAFWLKMDSKYAKKSDVRELSEAVEHYDRRLNQLETKVNNLPTAQDVAKLEILMTEIKGETKSTNTQMKAISHQVGLLLEAKVLKE